MPWWCLGKTTSGRIGYLVSQQLSRSEFKLCQEALDLVVGADGTRHGPPNPRRFVALSAVSWWTTLVVFEVAAPKLLNILINANTGNMRARFFLPWLIIACQKARSLFILRSHVLDANVSLLTFALRVAVTATNPEVNANSAAGCLCRGHKLVHAMWFHNVPRAGKPRGVGSSRSHWTLCSDHEQLIR